MKTNDQAIANVEAKFPNLRRNKDGSINGNAFHSLEMGARRTFAANGADWNTACDMSRALMRRLQAECLPPRNIVVGCDEQSAVVRITDQKTLREIAKVIDFLPERPDESA